jgi:hypothetical protein
MTQAHELQWTQTVAMARDALERTGTSAAAVYQFGRPIGVVTSGALRGSGGGEPRGDAMLIDVMDLEVVPVHPSMGMHATLEAYTTAAWRSLKRRRPRAEATIERRKRSFAVRRARGRETTMTSR